MAKAKNTDKLVVQNAAKTLLANIRFASVDDPIRTITVTSSIPNEGKSTVSINLAQAIATSGKSVLLVEADMRRRSLSDMLGVRSRGGLYAVLSEQISIDQAIVETGQKNFYFLDAEPHIPNPADISQLVVVVKDTTVAYVVSYPDLMQNARVLITNYDALVSVYLVIAVIYILINVAINKAAVYVSHKTGATIIR